MVAEPLSPLNMASSSLFTDSAADSPLGITQRIEHTGTVPNLSPQQNDDDDDFVALHAAVICTNVICGPSANHEGDQNVPPKSQSKNKDNRRAWIALVGTALGMLLVSPIVFTFGLYFIELQTAFVNVSPSDLSTLNGFTTGLYLFTGCFTGPLSQVVGHWRVVMVGSALAVCGAAASYFCQRFALLYVSYGIFVGFNLGICEYALIGAVGLFFDRYASFATLVAFLSFSCGCLALPPVVRLCIARFHWNGGMVLNAALIATLTCFGAVTIRRRPPTLAVGNNRSNWRQIFARAFDVAMLRDWRFYIVALVVVTATAVLLFGLFIVDYLAHELKLMSADAAAYAVTTLYAGEALGRLAIALVTLYGERLHAKRLRANLAVAPTADGSARYEHAIMICGTLMLGILFIIFASIVNEQLPTDRLYIVFVFAAAMGLCSSITWSYIPLLMLELFGGAGNIGTAWGFTQAINGVLKFGIDAAAGEIKVRSGTYAWSFRFAGMLLALSAVLMLIVVRSIPRRRRPPTVSLVKIDELEVNGDCNRAPVLKDTTI